MKRKTRRATMEDSSESDGEMEAQRVRDRRARPGLWGDSSAI